MGLIIDVYRNSQSDCTNGGLSSKFNRLTVMNVAGPFEPTEDRPAVFLDSHVKGVVRLVPVRKIEDLDSYEKIPRHPMMGGNYAGTSDSRFSESIQKLTGQPWYGLVAVHDRYEG